MVKMYCDKCKKEIKTYVDTYYTIEYTPKGDYDLHAEDDGKFDFCRACAKEFISSIYTAGKNK